MQVLLGHSSPQITLGIYTHLDKQDASKLRPIMDDLYRLFGKEIEGSGDENNTDGKDKK